MGLSALFILPNIGTLIQLGKAIIRRRHAKLCHIFVDFTRKRIEVIWMDQVGGSVDISSPSICSSSIARKSVCALEYWGQVKCFKFTK